MALTDNLISYWKLDEVSGNALDAHGSNPLTDNNSVGSATGKIGNARDLESTSSQYFSRASNAALQSGDIDYTFQAWVKIESLGTRVVFNKWSGASPREYSLLTVSSRFRFDIYSTSSFQTITANTFGAITTATWYHVVCWHDAVNNVFGIAVNLTSDTASTTISPAAGTGNFELGAQAASAHWDGLIDEVGYCLR